MRFLQVSDFHLDSLPGAGRLGLPPQLRDQLKRDVRTAVAQSLRLAVERQCDIALLPGDLFDDESSSVDTVAFLKDQLANVAPIPVVIAPGNHDFLSPASPYANLGGERENSWPGNVLVIRDPEFAAFPYPALDLTVTGIAHTVRGIVRDRLPAGKIGNGGAGLRLLIFHGSREVGGICTKEPTLPFTDQELLAQGFHYAAIGHYHSCSTILDGSGVVRGAYAGCTQGRGVDEAGQKVAIIGEIDGDGRVRIEQVRTSQRIICAAQVDVTAAEHAGQIENRIDAALANQDPLLTTDDIVRVELIGRMGNGVEMPAAMAFQGRFAHFVLHNSTRPDIDLAAIRRGAAGNTIVSRFLAAMDERIAAADEGGKQILTNAIYYGLHALNGNEIAPMYETDES